MSSSTPQTLQKDASGLGSSRGPPPPPPGRITSRDREVPYCCGLFWLEELPYLQTVSLNPLLLPIPLNHLPTTQLINMGDHASTTNSNETAFADKGKGKAQDPTQDQNMESESESESEPELVSLRIHPHYQPPKQ